MCFLPGDSRDCGQVCDARALHLLQQWSGFAGCAVSSKNLRDFRLRVGRRRRLCGGQKWIWCTQNKLSLSMDAACLEEKIYMYLYSVYIHIYIYDYMYIHKDDIIIIRIQVVPGRAGGGSFKRKKNHIAEKEFAYRMCARWPTIAMSKKIFWVWTKLLPLHGGDVMWFGVMCLWFDFLSSSDVASSEVICGTTPVLLCTTKTYNVLLQYYSNVLLRTTTYYSRTTLYYKVLLQYYSVLQSTTPVLLQYYKVLLCTTKYYASTTKYYASTTTYYSGTTLYYKVLRQYYSVLQSSTTHYSSTTLYYKVLLQYYSVLQSTTSVPLCTTKYYASTTL